MQDEYKENSSSARHWYHDALGILVGLALIILASKFPLTISLDESPLNLSFQTLAVILVAVLLHPPYGRICVLLYLILGLLGLPVFSGGAGVDYFRGLAGGYLLGFLAAVFVIEFWMKGHDIRKPPHQFLVNVFGTFTILVCGMLYSAWLTGLQDAFETGFLPFLPWAGIKILLGTLILWLWFRKINPPTQQ